MALSTSCLHSLKASQLKTIASLTGINSSGTKPVLLSRLDKELFIPKLLLPQRSHQSALGRNHHGHQKPSSPDKVSGTRIISIDMGIRNLAYCVLDIPVLPTTQVQESEDLKITAAAKPAPPPTPIIQAWHRIAISPKPLASPSKSEAYPAESRLKDEDTSFSPGTKEAFDPPVYARHAYDLVAKLLPYQPSQILIERQRYRSMGSAAIQEWTVRVNMFEAMLYAVLETLRREASLSLVDSESTSSSNNTRLGSKQTTAAVPAVVPVAPGKVASFWLDGRLARTTSSKPSQPLASDADSDSDSGVKSAANPTRRKTAKSQNKAAKVDIVGEWLRALFSNTHTHVSSSVDTFDLPGSSNPTVQQNLHPNIDVGKDALPTATAFYTKWNKKNQSSKRGKSKTTQKPNRKSKDLQEPEDESEKPRTGQVQSDLVEMGKLDDLADCLLQGVAWARWEHNRQIILSGGLHRILDS